MINRINERFSTCRVAYPAEDVLRNLPIALVITTDSIAPRADMGLPVTVVTLEALLGEVVKRLDR